MMPGGLPPLHKSTLRSQGCCWARGGDALEGAMLSPGSETKTHTDLGRSEQRQGQTGRQRQKGTVTEIQRHRET